MACNFSNAKLYFCITNRLLVTSDLPTTVEYKSPKLSTIALISVSTFPSIIIPFGSENASFAESGLTE